MTKFSVNYNSLENEVLYNVNKSLEMLKNAIYNVGTIGIPSNFGYAYYVKNVFNKNLDTYNKLSSKKAEVEKILTSFKKTEKKNISNIDSIKNVNMKYRKKVIN